ncbi:alcohol dehydrogenase [Penicillium macrosclerotiorum]|uniref:alcohol dehydrogenase n=1 Tax=Penicillium macrosclerotiorum TaxID=303699 RepID=UPI002547DAA3|nr:alcohol dehydrogenase [Penicillium macrosclerotiorum]KAJ5669811.1 alcohol dehydrogenase [Penicillium macrosclerotiorum]
MDGSMTKELPPTHRALKVQSAGQLALIEDCLLPEIQDGDMLVRVAYVSLNPVDSKSADMSPSPEATSGCDFSGVIISMGSVVKSQVGVGDRVCGCVFGNNPIRLDNGAFAEYVAVPAQLVWKIPAQMSFQTAATLGIGFATAGLALYHGLQLPLPVSGPEVPSAVLVYGGGTATGTLAIQLLRLSGLTPITTCSPRNFNRVKRLGAVAAFDYRSPTCGTDIREYTRDRLALAMDCITDTRSMELCYTALGSAGGRYLALDPFPVRKHTRRSVQPDWICMFTQFDQFINWERPYNLDPRPEDRLFAERWYAVVQGLLDAGQIESHPYKERRGGLAGVAEGIDAVRKGEVNGYKLVYGV